MKGIQIVMVFIVDILGSRAILVPNLSDSNQPRTGFLSSVRKFTLTRALRNHKRLSQSVVQRLKYAMLFLFVLTFRRLFFGNVLFIVPSIHIDSKE